MNTARLIVVLAAIAVVVIFTADALAFYHPGLGCWMSRDPGAAPDGATRVGVGGPVGAGAFAPRDPTRSNQYADGMSLYVYVRSNPIANVDPMGTMAQTSSSVQHYLMNGIGHEGLIVNGADIDYGPWRVLFWGWTTVLTGVSPFPHNDFPTSSNTQFIHTAIWRRSGTMLAGPKEGAKCECITSWQDIEGCIISVSATWNGTTYFPIGHNCASFVRDAKRKCCFYAQ